MKIIIKRYNIWLEICTTNICENSGKCVMDSNLVQSCICKTGYNGEKCEMINCDAKYKIHF